MRSSYKENNYGNLLKTLMLIHRPGVVVELGVLDGYSALHIAQGLKENNKGHLYCYDLWEDYEFKHGDFDSVYKTFKAEDVNDYITMFKKDAYEVHEEYDSVDIVHVDISNDGKTVRDMINLWHDKVKMAMIFEGGSKQRDQVEWMEKYNKEPIFAELLRNKVIKEEFRESSFLAFPSMTLLLKQDYYERKISGFS